MRSFYKSSKMPLLLVSVLSATTLLTACQTSSNLTSEPRYVPSTVLGEAQILTISPNRVACASALPMQCLQVQSNKEDRVFQVPYHSIAGFQPVLGTVYIIQARPQIDETKGRPTGDWTLQNIVSQRMVGTP